MSTVDLIMAGNDDHGVKDATLHVTLGNEKLVSKNVLEGRPPHPEFKATETLDLAKLRVKAGAKLNYWLTVRDNKDPSSNRFETAHQVIEVGPPVSAADKKKLEETRKNNREQVEPTASKSDEEQPPEKAPNSQSGQAGDENAGVKQQGNDENPQNGEKGTPGAQGNGSSR